MINISFIERTESINIKKKFFTYIEIGLWLWGFVSCYYIVRYGVNNDTNVFLPMSLRSSQGDFPAISSWGHIQYQLGCIHGFMVSLECGVMIIHMDIFFVNCSVLDFSF